MSDPRQPEPPRPAPSGAPPPDGTQGLTFRDLQRAIFLTFGLIIVYQMAGPLTTLLLFFLLVFILSAVLNPIAVRLAQLGVPRIASAIGLVLLFLVLVLLLFWLALPPLLDELTTFFGRLPEKQDRVLAWYTSVLERYPQLREAVPSPQEVMGLLQPNLTRFLGIVGQYTFNLAVGLLSFVLLLVLVIYTVAQPGPLVAGLLSATPTRHRPRLDTALRRILEQLKNWAFGSLILGTVVGIVSGVALRLLGVPYALLFGVIAGVGELVPGIGPILSAIPPTLVALTSDDPSRAIWVIVLFIAIQQLENNILVPMVMGQSLNLHPLSVTFTVMVMGALFGLFGAVLAVPLCAIVKVCYEEFYLFPKRTDMCALQVQAERIVAGDSPDARDETVVEQAVEAVIGDQHPEKPHDRDPSTRGS
ncbi:MAG: AI-2E family transporter [Armatimonadota bacterium]